MKQDIKDGKNVSVGDITVINEGISLAEKVEEKKVEEEQEVSIPVPTVDDSAQVAAPEITPDVAVGENETNNVDNVVPLPIPVPGIDGESVSPLNNETPIQPNIELPNVSDGVIFPEIPVVNAENPIDFNVPSIQTPSYDFNNTPVTQNNFSGFGNNFSTQSDSNLNNFDYGQSISYDNTSSLNSFQSGDDFPPNVENAIKLLKDVANEINSLKEEIRVKDSKIEMLGEENKTLLNENAILKNQVANYSVQVEAMRTRVLDMFGMGGMTGGMQKNTVNSYSNFNDSQPNNNGMNIAA